MAAHAASTPDPGAIGLLTFVTPVWLLGCLLLPVIRWLHRGGRHRRTVPVSRLNLWRLADASSPTAGERRPPDPAWRRRALLTALLVVALAGPQLPEQRTDITLWIDDSLSMLTREEHGTRLAEGLAQVRSLLAEIPRANVEVRTLGDPWHGLGVLTEATISTIVAGAGRKQPNAPPAALLPGDRLHWLLTDGADATLFEWPGESRPERIIQVASVTRNVGLERLSARRNLNDPEQYDVLLKVANGGNAPETRVVVFATDAGELARSNLRLDPGGFTLVNASIPASAKVRATLQPGDALAEDDEIVLDLDPLHRRRVATDAKCPAALRAAVAVHPALALAEEGATDVEAVLDCGTRGAVRDVASIRVLANRTPTRPHGSAQWSSSVPDSRRIRLDTERMQVAARLEARPGDIVLLNVGDEPLIVSRAGTTKLLETSLDFDSEEALRGPEIPLLVNLMFEHLLDSHLLDEIAIVDRGAGSAKVVPFARAGADAVARAPSASRSLRNWTQPFLVAALLVLLWELVALVSQGYRSIGYRGADSR
ncbi:MAG: BatA domain-containing protein [Betaproteobacteria bacterium]